MLARGDDGEVGCGGACVGKHPIHWEDTTYCAGPWQRQELLVKEALHI